MPDEKMRNEILDVIRRHKELVHEPAIEVLLKQFDLSFTVLKRTTRQLDDYHSESSIFY